MNISIIQPTPLLSRKVKFDLKPIFSGLVKGITHTATLNLEELGNDAVEVLTGSSLESTPNEIAFTLIKKSLFSALSDLGKESITHFPDDTDIKLKSLSKGLEKKISSLQIEIDKSLFEQPEKQKFLTPVANLFSQWLSELGVPHSSSKSIAQRLPAYFVFSLNKEWRENPQAYRVLEEIIVTPFSKSAERQLDWQAYRSLLQRKINENVFDEAFSLAQIYVPLNSYFQQKLSDKNDDFDRGEQKVVVSLSNHLTHWLTSDNRDDSIRVISGGPGSGKSSFTKIFCAHIAESRIAKPIYIPLHLIDPTRDVADEVAKFTRDEGYLKFNPLDSEIREENLLIVFDGLDELASQGKVAAQVAKDFVIAVERMVERRNLGPAPIKVIISGREVVVQENQSEFRNPQQVLTILPYYVPTSERRSFIDNQKLLKKDLRNEWWKKYGSLTKSGFSSLPPSLRKPEIDEITAQPLLNYLVALSFTRGKLDFEKPLNLNMIYADLITAVYERGYEKGRTYRPIKHISCPDFIRVLEEVGIAAWHASDGRSTSATEIFDRCRSNGLDRLFKTFQEGAEAGVTKLLAAFFFRKGAENVRGDPTYFFTHKSFGEYLTSARIIRGIDRIVTQLERWEADPDDGFDVTAALVYWIGICGPSQLTHHILPFIRTEIETREKEVALRWKKHLTTLLQHVVVHGMPMEKFGNLDFSDATRMSSHACESLVVSVNACARHASSVIELDFPSRVTFGSFIRANTPQRSGPISPILYDALSHFDLSGQCFDLFDFYGANLSHTVWNRCSLHYTNFCGSYINESRFEDVTCHWSNFSGATIFGTVFHGGEFSESDFTGCGLNNSSFVHADLTDSNFTGSSLNGVNFENCDLENVLMAEEDKKEAKFLMNRNQSSMNILMGERKAVEISEAEEESADAKTNK